jgi:hypothetical protein
MNPNFTTILDSEKPNRKPNDLMVGDKPNGKPNGPMVGEKPNGKPNVPRERTKIRNWKPSIPMV